jgi:hypothetical protein
MRVSKGLYDLALNRLWSSCGSFHFRYKGILGLDNGYERRRGECFPLAFLAGIGFALGRRKPELKSQPAL